MSHSEQKQSPTCPVCLEDFTASVRARVSCPQCHLEVCRTCVRRYLLNTTQQAHCMGHNCKCTWDREFLIKNLLKSFVNGEYKKHRAKMLLDQEKARMPETMPAVENYMKIGSMKKEVSEDQEDYEKLRVQLVKLKRKIDTTKRNIKRYERGETGAEEKKREFKRKCGVEGCRGFLSSQWKCGLCATFTCPHCFEVLGKEKNCGHVCDPNNVESANMIKKETKPCPSCATPIFKIQGCDQMWCTQCHIAFSWKSGLRVNGVIHNPHFYQWQREGGGAAPVQTPGAQVCGGLPGAWQFRRQLNRIITGDPYKSTTLSNLVMELHSGCAHFQHWELDRLRRDCQNAANNKNLRIKYLCKEISEAVLMTKLQQQDKKREKKMAQLQVYELLNTIFLENLNDIQQLILTPSDIIQSNRKKFIESLYKTCQKNLERCHKVRIYANKNLARISTIYSQSVGIIDNKFRTTSRKYKSVCDLEKIYITCPMSNLPLLPSFP